MANGNLLTWNGWTYTYNAQNQLTKATKGIHTSDFWYDGLGRQITRNIDVAITFNTWDGWNLLVEWNTAKAVVHCYLYGAGMDEMVYSFGGGFPTYWYYQDGRGNTSHLTDSSGNLVESYTYDAAGTPSFHDASGTVLPNGSAYGADHLFTGRQWHPSIGLYDNRNRFLKPDLGRFLQPDPIGFGGDGSNLYRYCGNNPANWSDPSGLDGEPDPEANSEGLQQKQRENGFEYTPPDYSEIFDGTGNGSSPDPQAPAAPSGNNSSSSSGAGTAGTPTSNNSAGLPSFGSSLGGAMTAFGNGGSSGGGRGGGASGPGTIGTALGVGSALAGAGEHVTSGAGYWLGANLHYYGTYWPGNQYASSRTIAIRLSTGYRVAGMAVFVAQAYLSFNNAYQNPTPGNIIYQGFNIGMGAVGFAGPVGYMASTGYFVIDATVGWDILLDTTQGPNRTLVRGNQFDGL